MMSTLAADDTSGDPIRRVLMIGTCRIYRSAHRMRRDNVMVTTSPHRFHTLKQVELALRYHNGEDVFPRDLTHTISRRAVELLVTEPDAFDRIEALRQGFAPLSSFDAYVIEIGALKEHYATPEGGAEVLINSLVPVDMIQYADQLEPLYAAGSLRRMSNFRTEPTPRPEAKALMRKIKNLLQGKPIVWVSHANIESPAAGEETLFNARARLAPTLQAGATSMLDSFYDPTALATALGRRAFFENRGQDLVHYTRHGHAALSDELLKLVAPDAHPAPTTDMVDDDDYDGD